MLNVPAKRCCWKNSKKYGIQSALCNKVAGWSVVQRTYRKYQLQVAPLISCDELPTCFSNENGTLRQKNIHRAQACKPEKRKDEVESTTSILKSRKIIGYVIEYKSSNKPQKHTQKHVKLEQRSMTYQIETRAPEQDT